MFKVVVAGLEIEVPREVEVAGSEAIERFIAAQDAAKPAARPAARRTATPTPIVEET